MANHQSKQLSNDSHLEIIPLQAEGVIRAHGGAVLAANHSEGKMHSHLLQYYVLNERKRLAVVIATHHEEKMYRLRSDIISLSQINIAVEGE